MRVCGMAVSIVVTDTGMFYPQMIHIGTKKRREILIFSRRCRVQLMIPSALICRIRGVVDFDFSVWTSRCRIQRRKTTHG